MDRLRHLWLALSRHARQARPRQPGVVSRLFFAELGTRLLAAFARCDPHVDEVRPHLAVTAAWTAEDFARASQALQKHGYEIGVHKMDLPGWTGLLQGRRDHQAGLLANPTLMEHEPPSDLLWAVLHLAEELAWRESLNHLPYADRAHLAGDAQRAYRLLAQEWLEYVRHLQGSCPHSFSLAVRTNPFDRDASPIVKGGS